MRTLPGECQPSRLERPGDLVLSILLSLILYLVSRLRQ